MVARGVGIYIVILDGISRSFVVFPWKYEFISRELKVVIVK